jgi:hypothetical protein
LFPALLVQVPSLSTSAFPPTTRLIGMCCAHRPSIPDPRANVKIFMRQSVTVRSSASAGSNNAIRCAMP